MKKTPDTFIKSDIGRRHRILHVILYSYLLENQVSFIVLKKIFNLKFLHICILGWQIGLSHHGCRLTQKRTDLTLAEFYNYKFAVRQSFKLDLQEWQSFNPLHHARKLMKVYTIDAALKIQANKLNWIRQNQSQLRKECYAGLMDYIHRLATQADNVTVGRTFILPSSAKVTY